VLALACDSHPAARRASALETQLLMSLDRTAVGDACHAGGTKVTCGADLDGDEQLDESEVSVTRDVCFPAGTTDERPAAAAGTCACEERAGSAGTASLSTANSEPDSGACPERATLFVTGTAQVDEKCSSWFSTLVSVGLDIGGGEDGAADGVLQPNEQSSSGKLCIAEPRLAELTTNGELFDSAAWYWKPDPTVTFHFGYAELCSGNCKITEDQQLYQSVSIPAGVRAYARIEYDANYFAHYCRSEGHRLDFRAEDPTSNAILDTHAVQCPGRSPWVVDLSRFAGRTIRVKLVGVAVPGPLQIQAFAVYKY